MTRVIYGPIEIHNVITRDWQQTIEYEHSQTDAIFTKFSLRFDGLVHANFAGSTLADAPVWTDQKSLATMPNGASATDIYHRIQSWLNRPRMPLTVYVGPPNSEEILLQCLPTDATTLASPLRDVNNGPKPKLFAISLLAGSTCYRISWSVECCKVLCMASSNASQVPFVLSNKWSMEEDADGDCRITRTITGDLRLSAPVTLTGNDFKNIVVPSLEDGFKRVQIRFNTDKTGLQSTYTVVDKQQFTSAPWPATSINATHSETTNDGINMSSEMRVRLTGRMDADPRLLLTRAVQIMNARLNFLDRTGPNKTSYLIQSSGIVEHIGEENAVEAYLKLLRTAGDDESTKSEANARLFSNLLDGNFGVPLRLPDVDDQPEEYDPRHNLVPDLYGYNVQNTEQRASVSLLLACYLQQPCEGPHSIDQSTGDSGAGDFTGDEGYGRGTEIYEDPTTKGKIEPEGTNLSERAKKVVYTLSKLESVYTINQCVLQLPIAGDAATNAPPSTQTNQADTSAVQSGSQQDADTCKFITLSRGVCRREIEMDTESVNDWPEVILPVATYTDGTLKGRLLKHTITPFAPTLAPNQNQQVYRVHCWYLYGLNRPPKNNENFVVGVLPFTKYLPDQTKFKASAYTPRLGPGDNGNGSQNTPSA